MKKPLIIIMMCLAMSVSSVHGQHPELINWYDNIRKTSQQMQNTENTYIKKEILYNGSIVPVAYGRFTYRESDSTTAIPFLYSYGRIMVTKDMFDRLMGQFDSTKVDVSISFQPISTSPFQKDMDGPSTISFTVCKVTLLDTYLHRDYLWLGSYWAITTLRECYKVEYSGYLYCGFYHFVPFESPKRECLEKKLDKLFKKQYRKGYNLLNFF